MPNVILYVTASVPEVTDVMLSTVNVPVSNNALSSPFDVTLVSLPSMLPLFYEVAIG